MADFWKLNPYLSKPALHSFTAQTPYGSNLAGPTRASVWMPKNTPALQSFDAPEPGLARWEAFQAANPGATFMDFLRGLAATATPSPRGALLSIDPGAGHVANLPPGNIHLPPEMSPGDVAELLPQRG